jgi:hypothetical protein
LDDVSLFADSFFTFLVVLNHVFYQFEWMNIVLFLSKKKCPKIEIIDKFYEAPISISLLVAYYNFKVKHNVFIKGNEHRNHSPHASVIL